ncbi:MAG: YlbF family regulator [Planctomycetota bacterium]
MDQILEQAARLGEQIAADPRGRQMADARAALDRSLQDRQLLADYEAQQQKMNELAAAGKPIEPEDKRRLADLHAKVIGSRVIKDVLKAQADYLELMTAVSQRIEEAALGLVDES